MYFWLVDRCENWWLCSPKTAYYCVLRLTCEITVCSGAARHRQHCSWTDAVKRELSHKAKLWVYHSIYVPALTYRHELWEVTEGMGDRGRSSDVGELGVKRMLEPAAGSGIWLRCLQCASLSRFPSSSNQEETPGQTQNSLERLLISSGMGTPWDPPGGAGRGMSGITCCHCDSTPDKLKIMDGLIVYWPWDQLLQPTIQQCFPSLMNLRCNWVEQVEINELDVWWRCTGDNWYRPKMSGLLSMTSNSHFPSASAVLCIKF